jgi:GNAT superfamily N-acetyltransferase
MFSIIKPEVTDYAAFLPLWQAYLRFYEQDLPPEVSARTWERFFDALEPMSVLAAVEDGQWLGFATLINHRSTWALRHYCYLDDLYVIEAVRGRGVGRALIEAAADLARAQGAQRLYWVTNKANHTAQALYEKVATQSGILQYVKAL